MKKQRLSERELKSLIKAKLVIDAIMKAKAMDSEDKEKLSNAGASILLTAAAFDYVH
jgi:hypothetical protein